MISRSSERDGRTWWSMISNVLPPMLPARRKDLERSSATWSRWFGSMPSVRRSCTPDARCAAVACAPAPQGPCERVVARSGCPTRNASVATPATRCAPPAPSRWSGAWAERRWPWQWKGRIGAKRHHESMSFPGPPRKVRPLPSPSPGRVDDGAGPEPPLEALHPGQSGGLPPSRLGSGHADQVCYGQVRPLTGLRCLWDLP